MTSTTIPIITNCPRCLRGDHETLYFEPSDLRRFASPTAWLNDICINDGTILLQLHFNTPQSKNIAIISTLALPTLEDGAMWRLARRSAYWEKPLWLFPIRCTTPYEHWVLGVMDFTRREIGFFDSIADESLWKQDVQV
jgi:hypothetical protein